MSFEKEFFSILNRAFLDIRTRSYEINDMYIFKIADLFHNVGYKAIKDFERNGRIDYDALLSDIHHRAALKNIEAWLVLAKDSEDEN